MAWALDFWCERCKRWTEQSPGTYRGAAICIECGEEFQCGECGGPIATDGSCLNDPSHDDVL